MTAVATPPPAEPARPVATVPLPPAMCPPAFVDAWAAHVAAGRLGPGAAPPPDAADRRCAGLAAAMGWASPAGRFAVAVDGDRPGAGAPSGPPASRAHA